MVTFYTAIGICKLSKHKIPTIIVQEEEYGLGAQEFLIWSILAFRILTYKELRDAFYEKERELHILGEAEFDDYLNRLLHRGLAASGSSEVGIDALYLLLEGLQPKLVPRSPVTDFFCFLQLWILKKVPFRMAASSFYTERLSHREKKMLSLLRSRACSINELITATASAEDRQNCPDTPFFFANRDPVLIVISNLYLKQFLTFHP
ncbi:MAG TPA: hypothetical protein H9761_05915 [Candidatus Eisenbergiella merdavium]|uniref:Uncharacterized protein n=1 Tax=Candidatus Eisenbergiella merdavium TaxID=2838551 RepID=A0A9D2NEH5_9FIRM|nr:hypothetical protein [Candidatus Eisenbergiella merdavium]